MSAKANGSSSGEKPREADDGPASPAEQKGLWSKIAGAVPIWAKEGMKSPRSWKTFIRCVISLLCMMILLVDNNSLQFLGQAAFFGLIVSVMLPPSMALSIFLFAMLTLVVGMCLGWAWGVATMAAGLRARDQVLLQQQITTTRSGFDPNANIDAQYQEAIFRGNFLDPKSSAVTGVMFFFGAYAFGFIRAHRPKLMLMAIFGTIIMDLMCSYGPLFPAAQYTIARMLLIPSALYIAVAVACTIFIFPQSLNHVVTTDLIKTDLKPIQSILHLQNEVVNTPPMDKDKISQLAGKAKGLRLSHVQGVNELDGKVGMLQLEITRGQIGAGNLTRVFEKSKELGTRAYALSAFVSLTDETHKTLIKTATEETAHSSHRMRKQFHQMRTDRHPGTGLDELMPIVATATADLRAAADKGLDDAIEWLNVVNHSRWSKKPASATAVTVREENLAQLKKALAEFRSSKHFEVLKPYKELFDENGTLRPGHEHIIRASTPSLFRCNVFTSSLIAFSAKLVEFLELLLEIEHANPKAKVQLPSAFAKMIMKAANEKSGANNPLDLGTDNQEHDDSDSTSSSETLVEGKQEKAARLKSYPRDPDAGDPSNMFQRFGRLFALKYGLVSIALWIPQVVPSSAWFTYHNRGLWALIMTGLGVFAGEQIASFLLRISGTIVGLVVGMVVWYIGAPGTATGNPYGVTAATVILTAPFLFMRILAPPQAMAFWLMAGVTILFVVGYSWVDEHVFQLANQGSGAALAGRRALLVIIGFTAAFIIMLFPRPLTARQVVRRNIAKNIAATSDLYANILGGVEEEAELEGTDGKIDTAGRVDKIRRPFLKIMVRMQSIYMQMAFASAEPGIRGPWPKKQYQALVDAHGSLISALALLSAAYTTLQPTWCRRLERTDHLHPAFVADCLSLFSLLHQSLLTGQPMPPTMPIFERLAYHSTQRGPMRQAKDQEGQPSDRRDGSDSVESVVGAFEAKEDGRALLLLDGPLTWDDCHNEQLTIFATAIVALTHVVNGLNEMQRRVIELVGVREMGQFEKAQERWGRYETA